MELTLYQQLSAYAAEVTSGQRIESSEHRQLYALDLLRFAAAMAVVSHHLIFGMSYDAKFSGLAQTVSSYNPSIFGFLGVQIFFTLSGYVIARSAERSNAGRFIRRRVERLWPAAFICATLTAALLIWVEPNNWSASIIKRWATSAFLIPWGPNIDQSYWTLGIEVSFYALVALMITITKNPNRLTWLAYAVGIASIAFHASNPDDNMMESRPVQLLLLMHGCYFALGIIIERWHAGQRKPINIVFAICLLSVAWAEIGYICEDLTSFIGTQISQTTGFFLFASGVSVIFLAPAMQNSIERQLPVKLVTWLGLMTYPLYLVHQEFGRTMGLRLMINGILFPLASAIVILWGIGLSWIIAARAEPYLNSALAAMFDRTVKRWWISRRQVANTA